MKKRYDTQIPGIVPQYTEKCFCNPGFIRESSAPQARCITLGECSTRQTDDPCGENEVFTTATVPELTCAGFWVGFPKSKKQTDRCFCKPGFIRSKKSGPCINHVECF